MGLKHQAASNRKLRAAIRQVRAHLPRPLPPLFFLTDPERAPDPVGIAERLPSGCGVIYRHFGAPDRAGIALALAEIAAQRGLCLLIGADPDLAQAVGAHGVHWPEAQLGEVRHWRGAFAINTASAHSRRAIWRASQSGMDAALVSAVFASNSASAGAPIGPTRFRQIARTAALPVYALGGLNSRTVASVADHAGLAAIEGVHAAYESKA